MGIAEIVDGVGGVFGEPEFLVEAQALLEMGGRFVEAGLLEQDRAEIEIGPGDAVLVLEPLFQLQRLADHLLGPVEILGLAIEQARDCRRRRRRW